jgi:predicted nucleotidyltransferase component of viral defense system
MNNSSLPLCVHADPDLLREALGFTASRTGFSARLIEKDYFCSVMLGWLSGCRSLVFKGGTCLAKVHVGFYRLSEDLDFAIPLPVDANRAERGRNMQPIKEMVTSVIRESGCFRMLHRLEGANDCSQYNGTVAYDSLLTGQEESIKIEFSLREPLLTQPVDAEAGTVLLNPVSGLPLVSPLRVTCISPREAIVEKYRAALTTGEVAIRDFYDIGHALSKLRFDTADSGFVELIRRKLAVSGNAPISVSEDRLSRLRAQLETRLKPVLRPVDLDRFDLAEAVREVMSVADALARNPFNDA